MSDILSQEEINALLNAVSTGELPSAAGGDDGQSDDKQIVVKYDFKRPNKVSKDRLREIERIHEKFAHTLTTTLFTYLRTPIELKLVAVDQLTFNEYVLSLSQPTWISVMRIDPLQKKMAVEMNGPLVFGFIDKLTGGEGNYSDFSKTEISEIEASVLNGILDRILQDFKRLWVPSFYLTMNIINQETNPQYLNFTSSGDTVIVVTFSLKFGTSSGIMSICYPFSLIEEMVGGVASGNELEASVAAYDKTQILANIKDNILNTVSVFKTIIGCTRISIGDLLNLGPGDVLMLDGYADKPIVGQVGDVDKYHVMPGVVKNKRAVKILQRISEEEK